MYKSEIEPEPEIKVSYEIYHVKELHKYLSKAKRKTGWILVNKEGFPVEITEKLYNNISVFASEKH